MLSTNEKLEHINSFLCTFHWCNNDNNKNTDSVPTIASSLWQRRVTHHCKHMTLHLLKPIDPTQTECATTYNANTHGRTLVSLRTTPSPRHTHRHAHTLGWQEPVFRADAQTSDMTVATHRSRRMMDPLVFFSFLSLFLWLYGWRAAKLNGGPNRQRKITTCQTTWDPLTTLL